MKDTVYTAPEGFFESFETSIAEKTGEIRSRRRKAIGLSASLVALGLIVFVALPSNNFVMSSETEMSEDEELIETYESDIFINNFQL